MKNQSVSRKKATIWNLVFSYSTVVYGILSGLLMIPLYLRFIPLELYGAWLASGNILHWVLVVDPGLSTVIMQRVGKSYGSGNRQAVGAYVLSGLLLTALIALLALLVGFVITPKIPSWVNLLDLNLAQKLQANFIIGLIAGAIILFAYSVGVVNLGLQRSFAHGIVVLSSNLLTIATTLCLLFAGYQLFAISIGLLVRAIVFSLGGAGYMLWRLKREKISLNYETATLRELLGLLSFTSLGKLGGMLSKNMDAFMIARFLGPEKVPVYLLSRRGMEVAITLLGRTGNAIGPGLSHLSGESNLEKIRTIINRLLRLNVWVLGLAFGGFLAFNQGFVEVWVGEDLFVGSTVSILFCLFMVLTLLMSLLQTLCVSLGDIKRNAVIQFSEALLVFGCILGGTYYLGMIGTALAPVIGFLSVSLWYYPRSLTTHGSLQPTDMRKIAKEAVVSLGLGLALSFIFKYISIRSWFELILWSGTFSVVYMLILLAVRPLLRNEILALKIVLQSKLGRKKIIVS